MSWKHKWQKFLLCALKEAGLVDDNQPEKEFIMGGGSKNE